MNEYNRNAKFGMDMKYYREEKKNWEKREMLEKIKKVYCFRSRDTHLFSKLIFLLSAAPNTCFILCQGLSARVPVHVPMDYKSDYKEIAAILKERKVL
jgi:hypothetical protein